MKNATNRTFLKISAVSLFTFSLIACYDKISDIESRISDDKYYAANYFANLQKLCGKTFVGETVYPQGPDHDFAGKKLVAHFKSCNDKEIRIPFTVGEDHSRTWIIAKTDKGLLLKHDHRHHDGTPDEITMYGGYAGEYNGSKGTPFSQNFLADEHTAELIPAAKSNVWTLSYDTKNQSLTYNLERHNKPRYQAILELK